MDRPDWQVTEITIYCDAVDDEVTVQVHGDLSTRCTGYHRYSKAGQDAARLLKAKSKRLGRQLGCTGPECDRVTQYRKSLLSQEAGKS